MTGKRKNGLSDEQNEAFGRLKAYRNEILKAAQDDPSVSYWESPAALLFRNPELKRIVLAMPFDMAGLRAIPDIDADRTERWGPSFLAVLNGAPAFADTDSADGPRVDDDELFRELKDMRLDIALAERESPPRIFAKRDLELIVAHKPTTMPELMALPLANRESARRWGPQMLKVANRLVQGLAPRPSTGFGAGRRIVLLDLDDTLVLSDDVSGLRDDRDWERFRESDVLASTTLPPETVAFLSGMAEYAQAGIVTNTPRVKYAERVIRHHKLKVPVATAWADTNQHKPHPGPLLAAAAAYEARPEDCLYIGDREEDRVAAEAAGMAFIGVAWNAASELSPVASVAKSWSRVLERLADWAWDAGMVSDAEVEPGPLLRGEHHLGVYHPYWQNDDGRATRNPAFDDYSSQILDLKRGRWSALAYFKPLLDDVIARDARIVTVPSHECDTVPSGIRRLGQRLSALGARVDMTSAIERHTTVRASHKGGKRSVKLHLKSCRLRAESAELIRGQRVVLLDDVRTSGSSIDACLELLNEAGPAELTYVVLGQTPRPDESA